MLSVQFLGHSLPALSEGSIRATICIKYHSVLSVFEGTKDKMKDFGQTRYNQKDGDKPFDFLNLEII